MATSTDHVVGRPGELAALERALELAARGVPSAIEVAGEAGIGKTRLVTELAARAEARGYLVLSGVATELERDLPFSVLVDACDPYLAGLEPRRLAGLDEATRCDLAHVFPSLWARADASAHEPSLEHERYRVHRAVRTLLERLASPNPLVLILDDLHWADPASVELLGALLRRPPAAAVLIALALRPRRIADRFSGALERAQRASGLARLALGPLTRPEARELLDGTVSDAQAAALYDESGGNPFYLLQLARSLDHADGAPASSDLPLTGMGVPAAVAASLDEELGRLSARVRRVLEGAAVAGDPFEPELAAAAAATTEKLTMDSIDELVRRDIVRSTDVPRRFRFRHPLVRRAVYEASPAGWRLGAHERCSKELATRGATAVQRAHHIERSARMGDADAVAVLRQAGDEAARLAPESAARWFGAALRLCPPTVAPRERIDLLLARAMAFAAAGRFGDSHEAALDAVALASGESDALMTSVATACASVERFLGRYGQAHARLVRALHVVPESASVERVELLMELTLNAFYRSRYDTMRGWAEPAVSVAREIGDRVLIAAAAVMPAFADAMTGPTDRARMACAAAAALVDDLSDEELSDRPHTAGWLAIAEVYLDMYAEADVHASRALRLTRATGQGDPLHRLYPVLPRIWYVRGKLAEAAELLDGAIEAGRLIGSPPALAGNLFNRSVVALATGDLDTARATAQEGVELTRGLDEGFVSAWAAARLAAVLFETGHPERAIELLLGHAGGPQLALIPGSWRAYWLELLTRCWLALGRPAEAERAASSAVATAAAVGLPLATAWADRASAAVALSSGALAHAIDLSLASATAAHDVGAPIEEGLSRVLAGRALGACGQRAQALAELQSAAAAFDACGALRYRSEAERELRKLGRHVQRRTRSGAHDGRGIASLTERELQIAHLVVDRRTNAQIAAELFLSQKTIETHMRNIFNKMDVGTRVDLARAIERVVR